MKTTSMDTYIVKWNMSKEFLMSSKSFHRLAMEGEIVYCLSRGSIRPNGGGSYLKFQTQCTHYSDFSVVCQVALSLCPGFLTLSHEHNEHSLGKSKCELGLGRREKEIPSV